MAGENDFEIKSSHNDWRNQMSLWKVVMVAEDGTVHPDIFIVVMGNPPGQSPSAWTSFLEAIYEKVRKSHDFIPENYPDGSQFDAEIIEMDSHLVAKV
jgi:hypothetical protein